MLIWSSPMPLCACLNRGRTGDGVSLFSHNAWQVCNRRLNSPQVGKRYEVCFIRWYHRCCYEACISMGGCHDCFLAGLRG